MDRLGQTLLSCAAEKGHDKVVKALLERQDVGVNLTDIHGRTPLHRATEKGHDALVRMLPECKRVDSSLTGGLPSRITASKRQSPQHHAFQP